MNLREAENIKKRWLEYTEELYKKDLNDPNNRKGVITQRNIFKKRKIYIFRRDENGIQVIRLIATGL